MIGMRHIFQKNNIVDNVRKPIITKEHGSWAILFVPVITGISASNYYNFPAIFFSIVCIFFSFMSYVPAEILITKRLKKNPADKKYYNVVFWLMIYLGISIISGIYLIISLNRPFLPVFALAALTFFVLSMFLVLRSRKSDWSDLLAVTGLTLSAPLLMYILDGQLNTSSLVVWLLNILFFGSSTVYVHMKIKASAVKKDSLTLSEQISLGKINLLYHMIVIPLLIIYAYLFPSRAVIVLGLIPMLIHAVMGTFRHVRKTNFKKLGFTLLTYSIVYAVIISISIK